MPKDLKFTRIKYLDKEEAVELEYDEVNGDLSKHSAVKGTSAPDPKLVATLRAFKPEMLYILELPAEYGEDMEVHQVSISYPAEKRGIVISAKRPVKHANSPFVPKTPFLVEPEDASQAGMTEKMTELLDELCGLAGEYLAGHRAQQELPPPIGNGAQMHIEESTASLSDEERAEAVRAVMPLIEKAFPGNFRGGRLSDNEITLALSNAFDEVEYVDAHDPDHLKYPHVVMHTEEGGEVAWCGVSVQGDAPRFWYDIIPTETMDAILPTFDTPALVALVRERMDIGELEPMLPKPEIGDKVKVADDMRRTFVVHQLAEGMAVVVHAATQQRGLAEIAKLQRNGNYWIAPALVAEAPTDSATPMEA